MFCKILSEEIEEVWTSVEKRLGAHKYYKALHEIIALLRRYAAIDQDIELDIASKIITKVKEINYLLVSSSTLSTYRLTELHNELKVFSEDLENKMVNCTVNFLKEIIMLKIMELNNYQSFKTVDVAASFQCFMTPQDLVNEIEMFSYAECPAPYFYQKVFRIFLGEAAQLFFNGINRESLTNYINSFDKEFKETLKARYRQLLAENSENFNMESFARMLKCLKNLSLTEEQKKLEIKSIYNILKAQKFNIDLPELLFMERLLLEAAEDATERDAILLMLAASALSADEPTALDLLDQVQDSNDNKFLFLKMHFREEFYSLKYAKLCLNKFTRNSGFATEQIKTHLNQVIKYELGRQNEREVLVFIATFFPEETRKFYLEEAMAVILKGYVERLNDFFSLGKVIETINFFETEYSQYDLRISQSTYESLIQNYTDYLKTEPNEMRAPLIKELIRHLKADVIRNEMYVYWAIYFPRISVADFVDFLIKRDRQRKDNKMTEEADTVYVYYAAFIKRKIQLFLNDLNSNNFDRLSLIKHLDAGLQILTEIQESIDSDVLGLAKNLKNDIQKQNSDSYGQMLMKAFSGLLTVIAKGRDSTQIKLLSQWHNALLPPQKNTVTERKTNRRSGSRNRNRRTAEPVTQPPI